MAGFTSLEELIDYGLDADLPAAGIPGRLYAASDTSKLYRDNGSTWDEIQTGTATPVGADILEMQVFS